MINKGYFINRKEDKNIDKAMYKMLLYLLFPCLNNKQTLMTQE